MTAIKFGTDGWRGVLAEDFTFANVKSSASTPRQPSVPNLIAVISRRGKYTRSELFANSRIGLLSEVGPPQKAAPTRAFLAFVLPAISRFFQRPGRGRAGR